MDTEQQQVIFGLILLFLVINSTILWAVVYSINIQGSQGAGNQSPVRTITYSGGEAAYAAPAVSRTIVPYQAPSVTPAPTAAAAPANGSVFSITGTPLPVPVPTPVQNGNALNAVNAAAGSPPASPAPPAASLFPGRYLQASVNQGVALGDSQLRVVAGAPHLKLASFVTLEMPDEEERENHPIIGHDFARLDFDDYVTVYRMDARHFPVREPRVSLHLIEPPLVIDYNVSPVFITDTKYIEYKTGHTMHNETIKVHRAYEDAWFRIAVYDRETGEIVNEDGVGRTDFFDEHRQMVIRTAGYYTLKFEGYDTTVNLTVRVKNNGIGP